MRIGLRDVLSRASDISVVGEVSDSIEAACGIERSCPDVVVVGHLFDCANPVQATRSLATASAGGGTRFLTIADVWELPPVRGAECGAISVLSISVHPDELTSAIRMVSAGYSFYSIDGVEVAPRTRVEVAPRRPTATHNMTSREFDVLRLVAKGCSNTEISKRLRLSESTIKTHVQSLLNKLCLKNRVCVAIYAYEEGLVKIGENIDDMPRRYWVAGAHG